MTDQDPDRSTTSSPDDGDPSGDGAEQEVLPGGVESIADLIDEAARTAAEQAEREATGDAPQDHSADVWADDGNAGTGSADAVWEQAEDDSTSHGMWGEDDADTDVWQDAAVWAEDDGRTPPAAADPVRAPDDDPRTRAEVAPPAGTEGMDHRAPGDQEPDTFTFAIGDAEDEASAPPMPDPRPADEEEEPEPFQFGAGPETSAPMPIGDTPVEEEVEEPEAFSFPVDEATAPIASTSPADGVLSPRSPASPAQPAADGGGRSAGDPVQEWTVPSAAAADGDEQAVDDVWTSDVTQDTTKSDETDGDTPLAESALPRTDGGWRDLEAEDEPSWSVPDLPPRVLDDGEEEPTGFSANVDDDGDDDAPWTSPALEDDDPHVEEPAGFAAVDEGDERGSGEGDGGEGGDVQLPADVVAAEVHDALGDLLGNGEQDAIVGDSPSGTLAPTPDTAQDTADSPPDTTDSTGDDDPLDELADLDLDQFDDLGSPAATPDAPAADDQASPAPPEAEPEPEPAPEWEADDEGLDAPSAAREVMEPGSVSFSSRGKKKKRGLFG